MPTLSVSRSKQSRNKQNDATLPNHPDLEFAQSNLKAQQLDKLLRKVHPQEGPHKAAYCCMVCGTYNTNGTSSDAWMFVTKDGPWTGRTVPIETNLLLETFQKRKISLKPSDVDFLKYLKLDLWWPEDGLQRKQANEKPEAEGLWKAFLVGVHRLAVPNDVQKYALDKEQYKSLAKQKNVRGRKRKKLGEDNQDEASRSKFSKRYPHLTEAQLNMGTLNMGGVR